MRYDLKKYRIAKALIVDIPKVLLSLDRAIKELRNHGKYSEIYRALHKLKESKMILRGQLERQKQIVKDRGFIDG